MERPGSLIVVFSPDLVGRALVDPDALAVLQLWREERLRPALNLDLMRRYLRLLGKMGLPAVLLRRWGWWFGSAQKCLPIQLDTDPAWGVAEVCQAVGRCAQARYLIHGGLLLEVQSADAVAGAGMRCCSADQFLREQMPG